MNLTKHWTAQLDDYVIDLAWPGFASQISDFKSLSSVALAKEDQISLAAASAAGPVSIFSAADGAKQHELPGHENGTNCLAWQPVGRVIPNAPGSTKQAERRIKDNPPYLLATGGQDGAVKFWDAASGQHAATASLGKAWIEQLAWRPVGSQISNLKFQICLAASAGRDFVLLNPDASVRHAFKPAPKTITALAWQPSGGCVAVAYFGGVCLWDADDFIAQKEFPYANGIHALVWSPDNRWLVSGNQDPSVHLWLPEQDQEFHMSGYEGKVKHLAFDHTSRWLATSGGSDACIWDCSGAGPDGRTPLMLPHDAPVCALAFQHSHGLLATASQDGGLVLWSPERKQPLRATVRMPTAATKLAWSPDDQFLAVGAENGSVFVLKCEA
ncbi:MAG TPA: WD40 repeat domain-containing protein [Opitutaceae bacterium]|nr:WD40 repeat domain-containing protein [Opitutaceae bacterium]